MPTFRKGNYWNEYNKADLFLFTSNGVLKRDGSLVMGAGTAKQVKLNFPGIEKKIGHAIACRNYPHNNNIYEYGLLISDRWPTAKVGAFQTKLYYKDDSDLLIITTSTYQLQDWCLENPKAIVFLPYPGIGCGNLTKEEVSSILDVLPDTVHIWQSR
jgi:hypothetical protein